MNIKPGYCFDDVLLIPKYSEIDSRKNVDTSVDLGKGIKLKIPLISANMKTITGPAMATAIAELGGLAILHRFVESNKSYPYWMGIWEMWKKVCNTRADLRNNVGVSVGVQKEDFEVVDQLAEYTKIFCVDVAHGDHIKCIKMTEYIAKIAPDALLIAGNVATASGCKRLTDAGADVIKIGIGPGSLCSTRIETGNGVPQLTALQECFSTSHKIIADGGIRSSGDVIKSLCFSDAVMLGNMIAGTDETPGHDIVIDGQHYKEYAGSSTHKSNNIEGVSALVKTKGPVKIVIQKIIEGLQSGCSYQGVDNLTDLKKDPQFVSISNAGLIESHPHDVPMVK